MHLILKTPAQRSETLHHFYFRSFGSFQLPIVKNGSNAELINALQV